MDSQKLMEVNNKEKVSFIYNRNGNNYLKKIILITLFILNLYIIFIILNLKNILKKINFELTNDFLNNSKQQKILKKITETSLNNLNTIKSYYKNQLEYKNDKYTNNNIDFYVKQQNDFCDFPSKYINFKYEELIKLTNFSFKGLYYQIYVYKKDDNYMSNGIIKTGKYEEIPMTNFLKALKYYGKKKNILNNKDIVMIDIGGNIGAHTSFLGKFGYSILTFEASPRNYYILNKNYCHINRNSNIIIINKGLSDEERTCNYYSQINGIGNGILFCNEKKNKIKISGYYFKKTFEVNLTKLSNFIPFLSNKNIALLKLDIEGGEGKAIESGIDLINKIHVPFIFSEFSPKMLLSHGTDPKKFLQIFIDNGYKISKKGFFSKKYINIDKIKHRCNLYFIYSKF